MSETIVVAILSLLGTIIGSALGVAVESNLMKYRISELEKKVDKHNNLIERMYRAEESIEILKTEIERGD